MSDAAGSLVRAAYDAVRDAVVQRELLPGQRVTVRPFAQRLGISPTPVKAALAVLEREGFLVARYHELSPRYSIAAPVIAMQARVAIGDHIGAALDVGTVLVVIGERPGLSVADSLGVYLTHHPRPGRTDAERNCVSNIHPPDGLGYEHAAATVLRLVTGARELGRSGVALKDTGSDNVPLDGSTGARSLWESLETAPDGDAPTGG